MHRAPRKGPPSLVVLPGGVEPAPALGSVAVSAEGDEIVLRLRRGTVELGAAALSPGAARALAATLLVVAETAEAWGVQVAP